MVGIRDIRFKKHLDYLYVNELKGIIKGRYERL